MQLTEISRLIFFGFIGICFILILIAEFHVISNKAKTMNEDNFTVYASRSAFFTVIFFVFLSGSLASSILFYIPIFDNYSSLLWLLFFVFIAVAIYFIYATIYYRSYETYVSGDELTHKELFYPEFTCSFSEIKSARFSNRMSIIILKLYTDDDTILEAEDYFVGYALLKRCILRKGVKLENEYR